MYNLYDREQHIYEDALKYLSEIGNGSTVSQERYKSLVKEYGAVLKHLQKVIRISDRAAEILVRGQKFREAKISELETMVHYDMLTGIYNRRYMEETLNKNVKAMKRSGGGQLGVLMLDLDFFKQYNDTYGHTEGDTCLRIVARTIGDSITRDSDFVARYGGEEFAVILPTTDKNGACKIADRILVNVRNQNIVHEKSNIAPCVTVSIGVTTGDVILAEAGMDFIRKADEALYISKRTGRNRYTYCEFSS